jgi:two-component system, NtrC family, sensor kinase
MTNEPDLPEVARGLGHRSNLAVPLLRDGAAIGAIGIISWDAGGFPDSQVELMKTFAEQAVIAISSAETFGELQRRTADLTRSVAELQALEEVLRAVNSSLELETVLSTIISRAVQLSDADEGTIYEFNDNEQMFVPRSAYGMTAERVAALRERRIKLGETHLGRSAILRAPVYVEDVQQDPSIPNAGDVLPGIHAVLAVPLLRNDTVIGGLVIRRRTEVGFPETIVTLMQTFSGQAVLAIENARLFQEAGRARTAAEAALVDLRRAQDRLVQSEKMASLGQLTAGIAHEIKNPLNFVNNFAALSAELTDELNEVLKPTSLAGNVREEVDELTGLLKDNLQKVVQHGKRADSIVKNMLLHSREGSGEHRPADINALLDESLNLAYHGARAEKPQFNVTLQRDFDAMAGMIELFPQEITRVFLNLISNGFYAVTKRKAENGGSGFEPVLSAATRNLGDTVEIRIRDNGTGIPAEVKEKMFNPFFTTKPAGEGTGLGLSMSHDIIVKQHGGRIEVETEPGEFTEFRIILPRTSSASDKDRGQT